MNGKPPSPTRKPGPTSAVVPGIMRDAGLILAAAGSGTRFERDENKVLLPLMGLPVFLHALTRFLAVVPPAHMVVVIPPDAENDFRRAMTAAGIPGAVRLVHGGASRQESVSAGLNALPQNAVLVAVHDAARPLATTELLRRCFESARNRGTGIAARPVTDTIKQLDPQTGSVATLPRDSLWAAETPQAFRRSLLEQAGRFIQTNKILVTDDAQAVEKLGHTVHLVQNKYPNPKLTYAHDIALIEALTATCAPPEPSHQKP